MTKYKPIKMKYLLIGLLFPVIFLATGGCKAPREANENYVVILSMDGFRWDYADRVPTPNLDRITERGVRAQYMKASFPTKTFPNHYSIATGLYPDHHGIVMNAFYDEETERSYAISDRKAVEDGTFYGGEPIWVTAEKQGVRAGSYFWVGSESEIAGVRPTYTKKYDHDFPYGQRIDSVIAWLKKPLPERPRLILWYFDEPDHSGHAFGPATRELDSVVMVLDSLVGVFLDKLGQLPIASRVNFIVTSDHGMGPVSDDRKVILSHHLKGAWIDEVQGMNPNFSIKAQPGCVDSLYQVLTRLEGITAWKSGELPERLHYGTHPRTLDLVIVADSSWSVVWEDRPVGKGAHGFDNDNPDMFAIFYACGPAFRQDYLSPPFNNIDIYPLVCEILDLEPAPVDGKLENVRNLLSTTPR